MSLFQKNPNEVNYPGGKKHFIDIIKNSGDGEFLIWRQPEEDFNNNSKLIVMPGETAIFVDGGNVVQVFESGTYQLSTQNYPFISRLRNAFSGGISGFNCVVYFFRKADSKEIRWGTDTPIQARDKVYGIRTDVRARGVYKVRIENPVLFLDKLVGNNIRYEEQEDLDEFFVEEMRTKVKSAIGRFLNEYQKELIGIDAYLDEISQQVEVQINEMMEEYGLRCVDFSIAAMDVDNTKYDSIDEAQIASIKRMKEGQGEKAYIDNLGQNWNTMQAATILNNLAQNPGNAGAMGSMAAGIGMGMATGNVFGQMANQMVSPMMQSSEKSQQVSKEQDPLEILEKLKKMLDGGLIEQEEYNAKKAEILSRM